MAERPRADVAVGYMPENERARTDDAGVGAEAGEPVACHGRVHVWTEWRSGPTGALSVEVGVRVAAAGPAGDLRRGASGGDPGWLGWEVEVGEDGVDHGRGR